MPASAVQVRFDYRSDPAGHEPDESQLHWLSIDPTWTIPHLPFSASDIHLQGEPAADELDFALLELPRPLGSEVPAGETSARGWVDLSDAPALPTIGSPILIVQHPMREGAPPQERPLQVSFATPGFGDANANGTRVGYKPSTLPGSSGAPAFGPTLTAVALHHNRGQMDPAAPDLALNNRGVPLAKIVHALPDAVRRRLTPPPA